MYSSTESTVQVVAILVGCFFACIPLIRTQKQALSWGTQGFLEKTTQATLSPLYISFLLHAPLVYSNF